MKFINVIILSLLLCSCQYIGAGSLGAWKIKGFPITDTKLLSSIQNLYLKYPEYKVPEKWKYETEYWKSNDFDTTKTMFFYFENNPEEMYFITLVEPGMIKNPEYARIAVASIYNKKIGWKEIKKYNDEEKVRIEERFEREIILKLEKLTGTKSFYEKTYP